MPNPNIALSLMYVLKGFAEDALGELLIEALHRGTLLKHAASPVMVP